MRLIIRLGVALAAASGTVLFGAAPAHASSVHVVSQGQSIQAAVDAAHPGDIIQLGEGRYDGGILVTTNRLTIRGVGRGTVLTPPSGPTGCAPNDGPPSGICVVGTTTQTVTDVTIKDVTVQGFDGFGIVGFLTDRLRVTEVAALDNAQYGISEFQSTRGAFVDNWVSGSTDVAGIYVGDTADARGTVVTGNHLSNNGIGVFVRHARNLKVSDNTVVGNCAGMVLLDDGQSGGQGGNRVDDNVVHANNAPCGENVEAPDLQGTGIAMLGGDHNVIVDNKVTNNQGGTALSGGIVLMPGYPSADSRSGNNTIRNNELTKNQPADLIDQSGSDTNRIKHNECSTSQPDGLCSR